MTNFSKKKNNFLPREERGFILSRFVCGMHWENLLVSAEASLFARMIAHPVDTIRTRLIMGSAAAATEAVATTSTVLSRGLFRGLLSGLFVAVPGGAAYIGTYEAVRSYNGNNALLKNWPFLNVLVAATCAEAVSGLIFTPFEVVKQRRQLGLAKFNFWQCQRGYFVNLVSFVPFSIAFFSMHEHLRKYTNDVVSSVASAGVASALTFPLDVVKTRIQVSSEKLKFKDAVKNMRFSGVSARILFGEKLKVLSVV
jgi:hypothetical protein